MSLRWWVNACDGLFAFADLCLLQFVDLLRCCGWVICSTVRAGLHCSLIVFVRFWLVVLSWVGFCLSFGWLL